MGFLTPKICRSLKCSRDFDPMCLLLSFFFCSELQILAKQYRIHNFNWTATPYLLVTLTSLLWHKTKKSFLDKNFLSIICKHKKVWLVPATAILWRMFGQFTIYISSKDETLPAIKTQTRLKYFFFVKFKQAILLIISSCWWCVKYAFSEIILQGNITALGLLESYTYIGLQEICALPCLKYKQQNIYFTKLNIHFQILTPLGFLFLPTLSCNISKYMIGTNLVVYNIIKTTLS